MMRLPPKTTKMEETKRNAQEEASTTDWNSFPTEIVCLILHQATLVSPSMPLEIALALASRIVCHFVCRQWRAILVDSLLPPTDMFNVMSMC